MKNPFKQSHVLMLESSCLLTWMPYHLYIKNNYEGSWFGGFNWESCEGTELTLDLYVRLFGFELTLVF
jgi:hypothetical protein